MLLDGTRRSAWRTLLAGPFRRWHTEYLLILLAALAGCHVENGASFAVSQEGVGTQAARTLVYTAIPVQPSTAFTGSHPYSFVPNGSFEEWGSLGGASYPLGWQPLIAGPSVAPEMGLKKFGRFSMKLTGAVDGQRGVQARLPDVQSLRGNRAVFGAWLYTSHPDKTACVTIDDWQKYYPNKPTSANSWQLVKTAVLLPQDCADVHFAIVLGPNDPPVVCYVDGAALLLEQGSESAAGGDRK